MEVRTLDPLNRAYPLNIRIGLYQKLFLQALTRHSQQGVPVSQDKLANAADSKALNPAAAFAVAQIAPQVQLLH
jgi:hypothetical protein